MIVVEGVDGAGKSTLVRQLAKALLWPAIEPNHQPGHSSVPQVLPYLLAGPVVIDRGHLTPQVYGYVLRGKPDLSEFDYWALTGVLKAKGCLTVLCDVPTGVAWHNITSRPQLFKITRTQLVKLQLAFKNEPHDLRFDYRISNVADVVRCKTATTYAPGMLGSPSPVVWLVGDEKKSVGPLEEVPFYGEVDPSQLLSVTLLQRSMKRSHLTWDLTALSNSRLWGRDVDLGLVWRKLGEPQRVVALGKVASGRLAKHGIAHSEVPHPQWWRRFRYHQPEEYARLLSAASRKPVAARREDM